MPAHERDPVLSYGALHCQLENVLGPLRVVLLDEVPDGGGGRSSLVVTALHQGFFDDSQRGGRSRGGLALFLLGIVDAR